MDRWLALAGCVVLSGCALGQAERPAAPVTTTLVREPLTIHADFALDERHPLLIELTELRERVSATLNLPLARQPIEVHLFSTSRRFHATLATRFPDFPPRRAFFVKQHGRYEVYAQWGEHLAEDLRHETTHAYLHSLLDDLPLWLDEGLAEYFETPPADAGWHAAHAELLLRAWSEERWRPDLGRLASLANPGAMTQLDYAEAWAWTHFLLNTTPQRRNALQGFLQAVHEGRPAVPLHAVLHHHEPMLEPALIESLHRGSPGTLPPGSLQPGALQPTGSNAQAEG